MIVEMGILRVVATVHGQVAIHDTRLKRPSLPDVKGAADDIMDEEEFKLVEDVLQIAQSFVESSGRWHPQQHTIYVT